MCRVALIPSKDVDNVFLTELFKELEKSAGGDGNGVGGFVDGSPYVFKSTELKAEQFVGEPINKKWTSGFLFHTRKASVGSINENNCHPFVWGDTITIHNGHIDAFGLLKLMMLENLTKYQEDGWTPLKIAETTDTNILSYFIWKRGFGVVPMMDPGTVMTMYPDRVAIYNGYCLQAVEIDNNWIYASNFSDAMGMSADKWVIFSKGSNLVVEPDGNCTFLTGFCFDGKEMYEERQKRNKKKNKKRGNNLTVQEYIENNTCLVEVA